jgi:hypothetical protein
MADYMTPDDFAQKVEWEGGIVDALEYGLHATDLDPDDEASKPLRAAWAALEAVYREQYRPAESRVSELLDARESEDEDDEKDAR